MNNNKKYQIFISSTYDDLKEVREEVIKTILKIRHFPIGMEMFTASDDEQWKIIQETLNDSDYYIVIIGHRYGSMAGDISYTEKEYDYAKKKGIPILAFIKKRDLPTTSNERDNHAKLTKKLDAFIKKAKGNKMCDFWTNKDDLASKIAIALPQEIEKKPRLGWIRGNNLTAEVKNISTNKKPRISLKINSQETVVIDAKNPNSDNLNLKKLSRAEIPEYLSTRITNDEIDNYNRQLELPDVIKNIRIVMAFYNHWDEMNKWDEGNIEIVLRNSEYFKATDVQVTMIFPDILSLDNWREAQKKIPINPLHKTEDEYKKEIEKTKLETPLFIYQNYANSINNGKDVSYKLTIKPEENRLDIYLKELLTTTDEYFSSVQLIPLNRGEGIIDVTIMCNEYENVEKFQIPIKVI
ncbi:MAG: DUF4062 domain-containing protein [Methylococcaceae bacterium]